MDAPDTLHYVMVRGLERRSIFMDVDREDFVARVAALAEQGSWTVYAWALLPKSRPPPGPYRVGHLFQNRYKSIVVQEEPYLLNY